MTDAIKALRDYLSKSPSVVYPQDVLEYLPAIEAEKAKLRELVLALTDCRNTTCSDCVRWNYPEGGCSLDGVIDGLGIEV